MKPTARPCVLYANDNKDVCDRLTRQLAFSGLEVRSANTVAEALWLARLHKFDLYLLDTRFTDDDGFELCRRMRSFDARTPILFFSGAAYGRDKRKGSKAGADAYIVKPEFSALVVATVLQLIARRGQARYSPRSLRAVTPRRANSPARVLSMVNHRPQRSSGE